MTLGEVGGEGVAGDPVGLLEGGVEVGLLVVVRREVGGGGGAAALEEGGEALREAGGQEGDVVVGGGREGDELEGPSRGGVPDPCELIALPLRLIGMEASPVRALLRSDR